MASKSFANADAETVEAPKAAALTTQTETTELAPVGDDFFGSNGIAGVVDKSMIQTPWVHLVHGVGDLSTKFQSGQLVLNSETVLPTPIEVTFLRSRNFLVQKPTKLQKKRLELDNAKPAIFNTPEEARAAGFNMVYDRKRLNLDPEAPVVEWAADMDALFKGTAALSDVFPLDFNGTPYLIARMRCKGYQHRLVTEKLLTQLAYTAARKTSACNFRWSLTTKQGMEGDNSVWRIHVSPPASNPPDFVEFAKTFV